MNRIISIVGAVLVLSGCATSGPNAMLRGSFYGVEFHNVGEAEQVQRNARAVALAEIAPLPAPLVDKKLIVSVPSFQAMSAYRDVVDPPAWNKAAKYVRDFYDQEFVASTNFVANAIRKRGLYQSVEIIDAQTNSPEPVPSSEKDYLYWKFNPTTWGAQMYLNSEKSGQVALSGDGAAPTLGGAIKALVNSVASAALTK